MTEESTTSEKSDRQLLEELHDRFRQVEVVLGEVRPLLDAVKRNSVLRGFLGVKE